MTLKGPRSCHIRLDCLGGLETYYGVSFKSFSGIDPDTRYEVLEDGEADASMIYSTDGELAAHEEKFVALEDDKHAFPAGNVIFVTSPEVIEKAGPDYEETIVAVQEGLTLPVVRELNAQVEVEGQDPERVAIRYLKSINFGS